MKIVLISDTHGHHKWLNDKLPSADMIIHGGDICLYSNSSEIKSFRNWYAALPYKHKICIAGNHDTILDPKYIPPAKRSIKTSSPERVEEYKKQFADAGITYLCDSGVVVDGINIWGSPWTPEFYNWAFGGNPDEMREHWKLIPENTDILITHGPPCGILDRNHENTKTGCSELATRLSYGNLKPKLHVFGHIHESYGHLEVRTSGGPWSSLSGTKFVNASICDLGCKPINNPILVEV